MALTSFLLAVLLAAGAAARPLSKEDVPAPLQPWISWVLKGHEQAVCPFLQGQPDNRPCAWPGVLRLTLTEGGGRFEQSWRTYSEAWIPLPGDTAHWPLEVLVDGGAAAVLARGTTPHVRLKPGSHSITGSFRWDSLPEQLQIPAETGLLSLALRGQAVSFPSRDEAGRLWLQQKSQAPEREESRLAVSVHRDLADEVPASLATRIQLKVSGKNREVLLGRALPEGFVPMSLVGPLPARIEPDGRLRVQARAGAWDLWITARHEGPLKAVTLPEPGGPWDADEAWVFEARPDLRVVTVEGAPTLDPQQTELPGGWRRFPAFLMKPGTALKLAQKRRGDENPKPDLLSLQRTLWLDFDGGGFTAQDAIQGTLNRSWRLEMGPETKLGRVSSRGQDQFLTTLKSGGPVGIEVREGQAQLTADSRVERSRWSVPAVGWSHDFDRVGAVLKLPPGWRLIRAGGADHADPTWVSTWTLLDLFLVLIIAAAASKLWGPRWGLAALAGVGLAWHELDAPRWVWLLALTAEALSRALAEHEKAGWWARGLRRVSWAALVLVLAPFLINQARVGLYPQLEFPYHQVIPGQPGVLLNEAAAGSEGGMFGALTRYQYSGLKRSGSRGAAFAPSVISGAADRLGDGGDEDSKEKLFARPRLPSPLPAKSPGQSAEYARQRAASQYMLLDPKSKVSTGPGVPNWGWRDVSLTWSGPVDSGQRLRLWLIPPRGNSFLSLMRIILAVAMSLLFFGLPVGDWLASLREPGGWRKALGWFFPALLALCTALPPNASAQGGSFPPRDLLDELRQRLLEKPECSPHCAESPRLRLEVTSQQLTARLDVQAAAATSVPLPSGGKDWFAAKVLLDGSPAGVLRTGDGSLWLPVAAGPHQVTLEGPLPARDSVQLSFPLRPRRVEASVLGWVLHGLREDGQAEENLQLSRSGPSVAKEQAKLQGTFPPFLRVERTIRLGLSWEIFTRLVRLTPAGNPLVLQVPLLPGESVTTADLRVKDGKVQVSLPPQASEASWVSTMQPTDKLALRAPDKVPWTELWRLEASPLWHPQAKGIPPVHQEPGGGPRTIEWLPWPGESVDLQLTRPQGAAGQTLTIDQSVLALTPGHRATDATLTLNLRTSRGGEHAVTLPEGADLRSVKMDGAVLPVRQDGNRVTLEVQPGAHAVEIAWREPRGIKLLFRTPRVAIGAPSVNAHVHLTMPTRWTLVLGGPRWGPAVLFWSLLAVFFLVSVGLGRWGLAPLSWRQWLLLSFGLTQVPVHSAAIVAGWFLALGWRRLHPPEGRREFNFLQVFLVFLTLMAARYLFGAIKLGLLGLPDMQIAGNGSSSELLRWYQDLAGEALPRAWVISVPLGAYRLAMLAWALWLANAVLAWSRWGWECFAAGGLWRSAPSHPLE